MYKRQVILRGRGIYQHRGITYTLSQGDAFLIPPIEITYYQADETDPWSYAWVGFDGTEVPQLLSHTVFSDSVIFRNTDPERISAFTGQMLRLLEAFSENPSDLLTSTGHLLLLFSFMQKAAPESYSEVSLQYLTNCLLYTSSAGVHIQSPSTFLAKTVLPAPINVIFIRKIRRDTNEN